MPNPIDPSERILRNLVTVQRLGTVVGTELQAIYSELFEQIVADLQRIDPTAPARQVFRRLRTERFLATVQERLKAIAPRTETLLRTRLAQIGRNQGQWAEATLVASLGDLGRRVRNTPITQNLAKTILSTQPFGGPSKMALLKHWSDGLAANTLDRVNTTIQFHMHLEDDIPTMVRQLRGTPRGFIHVDKAGALVPQSVRGGRSIRRFHGGVLGVTTRQAEALARTGVNHIANQAHMLTYKDNATLLRGITFVAVLDDRTTAICASLDGTFWKLDDTGIQVPPLHVSCRSALVPEVDYDKLGLSEPPDVPRTARVLGDLDAKDFKRKVSARRSSGDLGKITTVPSSTRYSEWLRRQPVAAQERVLGVGKARLFRERRITLQDIVRKDRSIVPLSELLDR